MLKISPKLIDVDRNMIPFINQKDMDSIGWDKVDTTLKKFDSDAMSKSSTITTKYDKSKGRFPTQLFTNIKNDRYKYVKNIT